MNKVLQVSILFVLLALYSVPGMAQLECDHGTVVAAENNYEIGKVYECLRALKPCVDKNGFDYDDKIQANQLIAMCYLAVDSTEQADVYITKLLTINDNFQPYANAPKRFGVEVEKIRVQMRATLISSVSKKNENINLAPATIQIITEEDIKNRGYKDIEEIFSDLPGFDISRTMGASYSVLYQRGYRTAANTDRTMLLVDGVEDNDMWSNAAFISKQFPVSNIKRIEIIYGPASTIYGANAYAGVVNIVTKGEDDYFPNGGTRKVAVNALAGTGSFNTNYANATVATHTHKVFFSVTGGVYHSDGEDLSSYAAYNGKYDYSDAIYQKALTLKYDSAAAAKLNASDPTNIYHTVSGNSIMPTAYAISQAEAMDRTNYSKTYKGVDPGKFTDPKNDYYVSSKLSIGDLKLEMEYWNKNESITPDYTQEFNALNGTLQNWQVRQGFFSAKYDKKLTERFRLTSFSYYRMCNRGDNAVLTPYYSYVNGGLSLYNLTKGGQPFFLPTYDAMQCSQFRTELSGLYNLTDKIDLSGGVELRNGLIQGNYNTTIDSATKTSIYDTAHYYSVFDAGVYGLISYNNTNDKIKIDLGGREDHNVINGTYGYGSVFNPRVAFIFYPSRYIFKAIYSEAFLDASAFNKFATASNRIANPNLKPEKVRNIELSGRYSLNKSTYAEIAYYHSWYSNSLVTANVEYNGLATTQYQALGKAEIQGVQFSAVTKVSIFSIYANATYTSPYAQVTSNTLAREGDIAYISANAGANMKFLKVFNLNMRVNIVGDKPTGAGTTTPGNPNSKTPGYTLLNGTLGYKIAKIGTIQFRVDNILNTMYSSPGDRSASGSYNSSVPQPGRVYYLQFNLNIAK